MCSEMIKLRQMLDDAGINWVDASDEIDMGFKLCFIHRTTIKQQVRDCYELTGFDPDEMLNEVIQERFNSNLNDN